VETGWKLPVETAKRFTFHRDQARLEVGYEISHQGAAETKFRFGVELNLTLLAAKDPQRHFLFPGLKVEDRSLGASGAIPEVEHIRLRDEAAGFELSFDLSPRGQLWRFPLETVSRSESGFQKNYQGTVLLLHWPFSLKPGKRWPWESTSPWREFVLGVRFE